MRLVSSSFIWAALTVVGVASETAHPAKAPAPPAASLRTISCEGPLFGGVTRAKVVTTFGAANVTEDEFPGAEGEGTYKATVLFAEKPADLVHLLWNDAPASGPQTVGTVDVFGSNWRGPGGIHVGSSIAEVEKANGKPFILYGIGWDYGGIVLDWQGGALGAIKPEAGPGMIRRDCGLGVTFTQGPGVSNEATLKAGGERKFTSDDPALRDAKLIVWEMLLSYGSPSDSH
jgi:hypothetical protein